MWYTLNRLLFPTANQNEKGSVKYMKKRLIFALTAIFAAVLFTFGASAVGEIAGSAVRTDIAAYINNYPISSYNIDGYTAVIAEELSDYGFTVVWDGDARTLSITANENATEITATKTVTKFPAYRIGEKAHDVYTTDIKTYINGKEVVGRNIGGYTIVYFEDLAPYGECRYDNGERALFLTMSRLPVKDFVPVETEKNEVNSVSAKVVMNANITMNGFSFDMANTMYMNISRKTGVAEATAEAVVGGSSVNMHVYVDTANNMMYYTLDEKTWYKSAVEGVKIDGADFDDTLYAGAEMSESFNKELEDMLASFGMPGTVKDSEVTVTVTEIDGCDELAVPSAVVSCAVDAAKANA